jgi:2,3-bisphosphoglycerate-independent phosphoglycerate mutase
MSKKPYMLLIRDGWGYNPDFKANAVYHAKTPNHDRYVKEFPTALIVASGENVGLPPTNQGSSEVGHLNMGAGRVVYQSLVKISRTIDEGDFFNNQTLKNAFDKVKSTGKNLHVWGLVQDQGVHAHSDHLIALLEFASKTGIKKEQFIIHVFSDGRDTPPQSTAKYIKVVEDAMNKFNMGVFGSIIGRYYSMDRDNRWERVKLAYDLLAEGKSEGSFATIYDAVNDAYAKGENDEFIKPRIMPGFKPVSDNDTVIFFNYRLDRTRELTKVFVEDGFEGFPVKKISGLSYVCFTEYYDGVAKSTRAKVSVVFPNADLKNLFGQIISEKGLNQLRIAETEKFAHVTFFFNGQSDDVYKNEDRILIPSPKVATYDLKPEMSAYEVKDKAVEAVKSGKYDLIVLNFANPDMVGHTGIMDAAKKACSVVDECVGEVVNEIVKQDGVVFLTADHGNSEQMIDYATGGPMTAHTSNLVWLHIVSNRKELQKDRIRIKPTGGRLSDIAPTMLEIMGIGIPEGMDGINLIEKL